MARSPTKRNHAISIALFALAFALRVIYLAVARSPFDNYNWLLAGSLLTDGSLSIDGVKTTAFEPLYPLFLAGARLLVGDRWWAVQVVQCAFGALGAPLLSWLTASLTGRPRAGVIAATMYAAYPLLIRYSGNISDATLTTVLIVGFAYAFTTAGTTPRAAAAGVWLGLTVLTRAMVLPLVPVGAALLWQRRNARAAMARIPDPRVAQFWDRSHQLSTHMGGPAAFGPKSGAKILFDMGEYVWDFVAIYAPGFRWKELPIRMRC